MIKTENDVFGAALSDYHFSGAITTPLLLHTSYGELEEMPIDIFFRTEDDIPELEFIALALCDGSVLDVGAGAGSHALLLQDKGFDVTALEISASACSIMTLRGVKRIVNDDILRYTPAERYDTLLFLMNGIGLAQDLAGFHNLLEHSKELLTADGQLIFDSSNIEYLYHDGLTKPEPYYGEVTFQYEYKEQKGAPFGWLYIDQDTLINYARKNGWVVQILYEDEYGQYLVRMSLRVT